MRGSAPENALIRCNNNTREGCLQAHRALPDAPSRRQMKKQDIRADIERRIAMGEGKSSIFQALKGQGVSDGTLAHLLASHADPKLALQHARLIKGMVVIAWVQLVLGVLIGLSLALSIINLPKALSDVSTEPASSVFALTLGVAWIAYTWFVRSKLFPDFAVLGPRKVSGTYRFSS